MACLEDVLEVYERPYDPNRLVVNMDEQPAQPVKETRPPLAGEPGRPRRYDHEYERAGTACVFLATEALAGWREARVRPQRTAISGELISDTSVKTSSLFPTPPLSQDGAGTVRLP